MLALAIVMTGVDPVVLTEYAVIFSVVALPLTYVPILLVANDRPTWAVPQRPARERARFGLSRRDHGVALTAIPLMILTNVGQSERQEIDIGLHVLDHQLLDRDGRRCGNVDDLAIEGGRATTRGRRDPRRARLLGPARRPDREARRLDRRRPTGARRLARRRSIDSAVELSQAAAELGLGRGDDRVRPYIDKIPERGDEDALLAPATQGRDRVRPLARPLPRPPRRAHRDRSCA